MATVIGTSGNDNLAGTSDNDILEGKGGADILDGGVGEDTVSYEHSTTGLNIFLISGGPSGGDAAGDVFKSIENVIGSQFNDGIYGDGGSNKLYGSGGADTLYGWGGGDFLFGGDGNADNLVGSSGIDYIDGGNGIDTLSYQLAPVGLTVSLANTALNTGWAAGDTYVNVEDCTGTEYNDIIYGDGQLVNNLMGLAGDDHIYGGDGIDIMIGGAGADYLDGGAGKDELDYEDSPVGLTASMINPAINTGYAKGDTYVNLEDLAGSEFSDVLQGDDNNNDMIGLGGDDVMYGLGGNDAIDGRSGNDTLYGGDSWDLLVGGAGDDTAAFSGKISDYVLRKSGGNYTVGTNVGNEGTDTLQEVEHASFFDMTVNLTVQAITAGTSQTDVQRLEELYVAFFNRVPDADGLAYWIGQMHAGQGINPIAEAFYNAGVQYSNLTGFSSSMSNEDFVNVIYKNVLGRSSGADAGGLAYWSGELASGHATHGSLVSTMLGSAHTFKGNTTWGWVADLLDNKIAVANKFAVEWGLSYNTPDDSISHGMAIAAAVTSTSTAEAIALIGISTNGILLT